MSDTIWIVTEDTPETTPEDGTKGLIPNSADWRTEVYRDIAGSKGVGGAVKVSVEKLQQEMTRFLQVVESLFNQAQQKTKLDSGMQLEEIELSVEISGEGEVKLIGNGAKASGKGAIKLTFKRKETT
jgi:hypothetical protein